MIEIKRKLQQRNQHDIILSENRRKTRLKCRVKGNLVWLQNGDHCLLLQ